jgi:hypothetical protein
MRLPGNGTAIRVAPCDKGASRCPGASPCWRNQVRAGRALDHLVPLSVADWAPSVNTEAAQSVSR